MCLETALHLLASIILVVISKKSKRTFFLSFPYQRQGKVTERWAGNMLVYFIPCLSRLGQGPFQQTHRLNYLHEAPLSY